MAALMNLEIYEVLAGLARPCGDRSSVLNFTSNRNREWIRRLREDTPFESLAVPVLGALSGLGNSQVEQVIKEDVKPILPPESTPVSLDAVPRDALVRLGFADLVNAVDEYHGDAYNRVLEGSTHLGFWTVAIALDIADGKDTGRRQYS